jgi:hypothetical protein
MLNPRLFKTTMQRSAMRLPTPSIHVLLPASCHACLRSFPEVLTLMQLAVPAYRFQGPFEKAWEQAHERGMSDVRDARESGVESRTD